MTNAISHYDASYYRCTHEITVNKYEIYIQLVPTGNHVLDSYNIYYGCDASDDYYECNGEITLQQVEPVYCGSYDYSIGGQCWNQIGHGIVFAGNSLNIQRTNPNVIRRYYIIHTTSNRSMSDVFAVEFPS